MLSEDRIALVNKIDEEYIITLKQKDSDDKCVVFTANRLFFSIIRHNMLFFLVEQTQYYCCDIVTDQSISVYLDGLGFDNTLTR